VFIVVRVIVSFQELLDTPSYYSENLKGRDRRRWEDNINKMNLKETGYEGVTWVHVAQYGIQWQASVNTVINFRAP
jgi:hypothetical protein